MTDEARYVLAREWLVFLAALAAGLVLLPPLVPFVFRRVTARYFYATLVGLSPGPPVDVWIAWGCAGVPYALLQLARSVRWAWTEVQRRP